MEGRVGVMTTPGVIEELHVYDFDGTLVDTPVPERGMAEFEEATGTPWPHRGWWGRAESLQKPLTWKPGPALGDYRALSALPRCRRVMLTGRRHWLAPQVTDILNEFDVVVDEKIFNATGKDTLTYKANEIRRMIREAGPGLRRVRIWEDRVRHAAWFEEFGETTPEFAHIERWDVVLVEPSNDF
jgi:hypothetical protein|tara:strand:+ start:324 stop:878 length:555 start_codon:yes stop_codon:yes gene_type:complete|mmetsp:Transcript_2214/g.7189  ORF Transcript_2214/g.7189 Transcript_2214/m.7189 type:complete len:185 (+) Transcript_2214:298-852(+)|eukprot:31131-Pelagococcus_subviridis.AAC.4